MAAVTDDEEMNYWPGFVDALSTMTMMLIFLMLILSLVIISVSQNVSRNQITAIAKAANINVQGKPQSIDGLTAQIIAAMAMAADEKNAKASTPASSSPSDKSSNAVDGTSSPAEKTSLTAEKSAASGGSVTAQALDSAKDMSAQTSSDAQQRQHVASAEAGAQIKAAVQDKPAADTSSKSEASGVAGATISNGKSALPMIGDRPDQSDVPSANPPKSSQIAELEPNSGSQSFAADQAPQTDTRIVSVQPADMAPFGGGVEAKEEKTMVTLVFPYRALKFDDDATKKLTDFVSRNLASLSNGTMRIKAIANLNNGNVTEARRFAYYRAMVIRQFLVANKVPNSQITINIQDVTTSGTDDIVELLAK